MANFKKFTNWFWKESKKWSWLILIFFALLIIFFKSWDIDLTVKVATIIAAVAAAGSLIYLGKQIKISVEQQKIQRAYEYMKRYNDPEFRRNIPEVLMILKRLTNDWITNGAKWNELKEGTEKRNKLSLVFNFFEEMGIMYNRDLVSREVIRECFKGVSLSFYKDAERYIKKRKEKNPRLFENWEQMNKSF